MWAKRAFCNAAIGCRLTGPDHTRAPVELPDGSVIVPAHLAGAVRRLLVRDLAEYIRRDGGAPTATVRPLLYALARAEHHHDQAATPAMLVDEPTPGASPIVEIDSAAAAAAMGCGVQHVTRLCRSGRILGRRIGRAWLIDRASLDRYRYGGTP